MNFSAFLKYFNKFIITLPDDEQLKKRRTREKDLIETFTKDDDDLDFDLDFDDDDFLSDDLDSMLDDL